MQQSAPEHLVDKASPSTNVWYPSAHVPAVQSAILGPAQAAQYATPAAGWGVKSLQLAAQSPPRCDIIACGETQDGTMGAGTDVVVAG